MKFVAPLLVVFAIAGPSSLAGAEELGSVAPRLIIDQWVKGGPVVITPGENIYVIEFWATWCVPCRQNIPHMSELQRKFKDQGVVVIGVSNEDIEIVRPFVEEQGSRMEYSVAVDKDRLTNRKYMVAFNQDRLPTAFVVNKQGQIVWVGRPRAELDKVVQSVVDGSYRYEKAKLRQAHVEQILELVTQLDAAIAANDVAKIESSANEILTKSPDEPRLLVEIARLLLSRDDMTHHNYPLAVRFAKSAVDATDGRDSGILDTYARARFETGDIDGAIATQEAAIAVAPSPAIRVRLRESLDLYRKAAAPK